MRPTLRLPYHRGTTAHVSSIYPFSVQASFGHHGTYIGLDLLAGGAEFCWDPFEAYTAGLVTNPNGWVLGEPGNGKSALVKCLLWRQAAVYGHGPQGRWTAIADPKGEYATLAHHLGLATIRLAPGGTVRINPLAPGPAAASETEDKQVLRRAEMCVALVATVLERQLTQLEDAAIFAAIEELSRSPLDEPTLVDVARLIADPTAAMAEQLRRPPGEVSLEVSPVAYALDKLLSRSLRGMFDGPSTVPLRWDGPGLVLDLSAVPLDSDALPLVMVAAAGWLQQLMACPGRTCPGPQRSPGRCWATATPPPTSRPASSWDAPTAPPTSPSPTAPRTSPLKPTTAPPPPRSPRGSSRTPPRRSSCAKPPTSSTPPPRTSGSATPNAASSASSPVAGLSGKSAAAPPSFTTSSPPAKRRSATPTTA
ncbi:MAG: hypothetical protein U5R31_16760 [Acidimicrobiia bacterium]|nr:hypothetical protein [Acidimicrobiia bacterium]